MFLRSKSFLVLLFILGSLTSFAQPLSERLKQYLSSVSTPLTFLEEVKEFYSRNNYNFSWFSKQHAADLAILANYIDNADMLGIRKDDYHPALFKTYTASQSAGDSLSAELQFTDAAIHWMHDVLMGNMSSSLGYNGFKYGPACYDLPVLLNNYLVSGRFSMLLAEQESKQPEYLAVKSKLVAFQKMVSVNGFKDAIVPASKPVITNKPLLTRLYQLGFLASDTITLTEKTLGSKLKEAQKMLNVLNDGELRSTTLQVLNVPLQTRIAELKNTLNTMRWLNCIKKEQHVVIVNIPSANLLLYEHEKLVMESRVIVGKRSTPTPTLSSTITEVILYPYWNVPYKIATQELLPAIKRNPGYINANNYQVLNSSGKVVDPSKVNWHSLSTGNFPYTIRQSTGCDNALGLIKLNFYNPFSVYLHDTPNKYLFSLNKRYFSHGCMRLQKAMELGRYIMQGNTIALDTLSEKGCLKNQSPITVPATEKIPVFVLYQTAWVDGSGSVFFYDDVYDRVRNKY
jgi:murein L,D-transpeptidase YcbB/YkuD